MKKLIRIFFYGNIFYGFCTVALSIETNLQHGIYLNSLPFYVLIFLATIVFYSRIYYKSSAYINLDDRTAWYRQNRPAIRNALLVCSAIILLDILFITFRNYREVFGLTGFNLVLIAAIPLIGLMYSFQIFPRIKLRGVGWLKPFVIGFVWAGTVTVFPILFWHIRHPGTIAQTIIPTGLLWLQNFLYISALAVIFDIKDHRLDRELKLHTYPAKLGIRKTVSFVIIPLNLTSFSTLIIFQTIQYYAPLHTFIQSIPYIALFYVCINLHKERNLLYYLTVIDGLMFLKAVCGIVSLQLF